MNPIQTAYLNFLDQQALSLGPFSLSQMLLPSLMLLSILFLTFILTFNRASIRKISALNLAFVFTNILLFQACSEFGSVRKMPTASPAAPSANPLGGDLDYYFGSDDGEDPSLPKIDIMGAAGNRISNSNSSNSFFSFQMPAPLEGAEREKLFGFNLWARINPDCASYNLLNGVTKKADAGSEQLKKQCQYAAKWFDTEEDGETIRGVKHYLEKAKNGNGRLVLDLRSSNSRTPHIRAHHGEPFLVLAYYLKEYDNNLEQPIEVVVLNPELIDLDILSNHDESEGGELSVWTRDIGGPSDDEYHGWFVGTYASADLNPERLPEFTIQLKELQSGPEQSNLDGVETAGIELSNNLVNQSKVKVSVYPHSRFAGSPETMMMPTLTSQFQEPIRASYSRRLDGVVNLASGESIVEAVDQIYPLVQQGPGFSFSVVRTYRSFYQRVSDFGWGQSLNLNPRLQFYGFSNSMLIDHPNNDVPHAGYPFLHSGDGRLISLSKGPFFSQDDLEQPDLKKAKYFYGLEADSFDLNGRLVRTIDTHVGNPIYRVFSGSDLDLVMDHILATHNDEDPSQVKSKITDLLKDTDEACDKLKSNSSYGNSPNQPATFRNFVREKTLSVPGHFLKFCRDDNTGLVRAIFGKDGFFNWYVYDGLKLVKVYFYAPEVDSDWPASHSYEYHEFSDSNQLALLKEYRARELSVFEFDYEFIPQLVGEFPLTTNLRVNEIEREIEYEMESNFLPSAGSDAVPGSQNAEASSNNFIKTEVSVPGLSSQTFYFLPRLQFLLSRVGPTETQNEQILERHFYDLSSLRLLESIGRGQKSIVIYDEAGHLRETKTCSAFDDSGNFLSPSLGSRDCPGAERFLNFTGASHFPSYHANFDVQPVGLGFSTSGMSAPSATDSLVVSGDLDGCFGGLSFTYINGVFQGGSKCSLEERFKGGYWLIYQSQETHLETGLLLRETFPKLPHMETDSQPFGCAGLDPVNQVGFYSQAKRGGYDKVLDDDGQLRQRNSGQEEGYCFDPRANLLQTRWKSSTITHHYDHSHGVAKRIKIEGKNTYNMSDEPFTQPRLASQALTNLMQLHNVNGEQNGVLANELSYWNLSQNSEVMFEARYNKKGLPILEQLPSGDLMRNFYDEFGLMEQSIVSSIINCTNTDSTGRDCTDFLIKPKFTIYERDDFKRIKKIIKPDDTEVNFIYRTNFDRGLEKTISDERAQGGGIIESTQTFEPNTGLLIRAESSTTEVESVGPAATVVELAYGLFGEPRSKSTQFGPLRRTEEFERDPVTGIVYEIRSSETSELEGSDDEIYVTQLSDFHPVSRRPQRTLDAYRNIEVYKPAANNQLSYEISTFAPATYRGGTRELVRKQSFRRDGCGVVVEKTDWASQGLETFSERSEVDYDKEIAPCQPLVTINQINNWKTRYHYNQLGEVAIIDDSENPNAIGHTGDVIFTGSLRRCGGLHSQAGKACLDEGNPSPGTLAHYSIVASYGQLDSKTNWHPKLVLQGATRQISSGTGNLVKGEFVGTNIFVNREEHYVDGSQFKTEVHPAPLGDYQLSPQSIVTESLVDRMISKRGEKDETNQFFDPILGVMTRSEEKVDRYGVLDRRETVVDVDLIGRTRRIDVSGDSSSDLINTIEILDYHKHKPKRSKTTNYFDSGQSVTEYDYQFLDYSDLANRVDIKTTRGSIVTRSSTITDEFSGLGVPTSVTTVNEAYPNSNSLDLETNRTAEYDWSNRLVEATVSYTESVPGGSDAVIVVPGVNGQDRILNRKLMDGKRLKVKYDWNEHGFEIEACWDGACAPGQKLLRSQMNVSRGYGANGGRLHSVSVEEPSPVGLTRLLGGPDPYPAHIDFEAGQIEANVWWGPLSYLQTNVPAILKNAGRPFFEITESNPQAPGRTRDKSFSGVTYKPKHNSDILNSVSFVGMRNDLNHFYTDGLVKTLVEEQEAKPEIDKYFSCDQVMPRTLKEHTRYGFAGDANKPGLIGSESFVPERLYDANERLVYAKDQFLREDNRQFVVKVWNYYDDAGYVGSDQVIEYKNPSSPVSELRDGQVVRAIITRFYNIQVPGAIGAGLGTYPLVAIIQDSGQSSFLAASPDPEERSFNSGPNTSGTYAFVPGVGHLPLWAFKDDGQELSTYRLIQDAAGNFRTLTVGGSAINVPSEKINNLMFGTSVKTIFDRASWPLVNESPRLWGWLPSPGDSVTVVNYDHIDTSNWSEDSDDGRRRAPRLEFSHSPEHQPFYDLPFGMSGKRTNVLGHVALEGGFMYDPYIGSVLKPSAESDSVCTSSSQMLAQSQLAFNALRARKITKTKGAWVENVEDSFSASPAKEEFVWKEFEKFSRNKSYVSALGAFWFLNKYDAYSTFKAAGISTWTATIFGGFGDFVSMGAYGDYQEGNYGLAALKFASVLIPGGGFIGGKVGMKVLAAAGMSANAVRWGAASAKVSALGEGLGWVEMSYSLMAEDY